MEESTSQLILFYFLMKKSKVISSVIVVNLDEDEKIERLVDQWTGAELPAQFGAQYLRIMNAKVLPWLIRLQRKVPSLLYIIERRYSS